MLRLGLTGGIGSGKSTVARIFEELGVPVFYADKAARGLLESDAGLREKIIANFGPDTYKGNTPDRARIAQIVFSDPVKLSLLNSLTHPATIRAADEWMQRQTYPYTIKEAALMFESDAWKFVDKVIGVSAPETLRIQRVMQRDQVTFEDVQKRILRQLNEEEKMKRCDFILYNDEQTLLLPQVLSLHERLLALAATTKP